MDHVAIAQGGATVFTGRSTGVPPAERLPWYNRWKILIIGTNERKDTAEHIRAVRAQLEVGSTRLETYIREVSAAAEDCAAAIRSGDLATLRWCMETCHELMRGLQSMSTPKIELIRDIATRNGIPGLKLTGAGSGGSLVAVIDEAEQDQIGLVETTSQARRHGLAVSAALTDVTSSGVVGAR